MSDHKSHRPSQLSGGQEQRDAIARALETDPKIVLADEPTGDLDRDTADSVLELLQRLNRELHKSILMVTHDPQAALFADKVIHLDKGKLGRIDDNHPAGAERG
jgi:putative ABC transport system ATP-binding protein